MEQMSEEQKPSCICISIDMELTTGKAKYFKLENKYRKDPVTSIESSPKIESNLRLR